MEAGADDWRPDLLLLAPPEIDCLNRTHKRLRHTARYDRATHIFQTGCPAQGTFFSLPELSMDARQHGFRGDTGPRVRLDGLSFRYPDGLDRVCTGHPVLTGSQRPRNGSTASLEDESLHAAVVRSGVRPRLGGDWSG